MHEFPDQPLCTAISFPIHPVDDAEDVATLLPKASPQRWLMLRSMRQPIAASNCLVVIL
jgi:hypothetical protein